MKTTTKQKTMKEVRIALSLYGVSVTKTEDGEFRVVLQGETEKSAYYTDDADDAIGTGKLMRAEADKKVMRKDRDADAAAVKMIRDVADPLGYAVGITGDGSFRVVKKGADEAHAM